MKAIEITFFYWVILFPIYIILFARLFFTIVPLFYNYLLHERMEWNEKINPEKLNIYTVLLLVATFLIFFAYPKISISKYSLETWITLFVVTLGQIGIFLLIEIKIRTPSKKCFKGQYALYAKENTKQNILFETNDDFQTELGLKKSVANVKGGLDLNELKTLDLEVFQDPLNFKREGNKIILLKTGGKKKMKDRRYLLSVLDKEFDNEFSKIGLNDYKRIKEVVFFINKHILFKCEKYPDENDYNEKNFKDWLKKQK